MSDECRYCASERVAPVLDKRIEQAPTAGNKYRTRCLACWRWLPMTSSDAWENSQKRWVLPADADPDNDDNLVTSRDYGHPEAEEELAEKVGAQGVDQYVESGQAVATDGGETTAERATTSMSDDQLDEAVDDDLAPDADLDEQPEPENEFSCPSCGHDDTGFPDECASCGAPYNWPDQAEDEE